MTPDKRATLLAAFIALLGAGLVVGGWLTGAEWAQAVVAFLPAH